MGAIFSYSLVSAIMLVALYLMYKWILAGEKQYAFNRMMMWVIYSVSLVAPLAVPSLGNMRFNCSDAAVADGVVEIGDMIAVAVVEESSWLSRIILWVYMAGMACAVVMTAITAVRLRAVITSGRRVKTGCYTLVLTPDAGVAPFSWMRYIVMSESDYATSGEVILAHERRHLDAMHWIDMLMAQVVCVLQWFNPAAWLMREELKTVHEYQADEAVIASGADPRSYQMLLIKKAVGSRFPSIANSLNHSKLKKRVTMMYKSKSSVAGRVRALALVPAGALALLAVQIPVVASAIDSAADAQLAVFTDKDSESAANGKTLSDAVADSAKDAGIDGDVSYYVDGKLVSKDEVGKMDSGQIASIDVRKDCNPAEVRIITVANGGGKSGNGAKKTEEADEAPMSVVEEMPEYPGGIEEMMKFVFTNTRYPEAAFKAGKEGRVVVKFVVSRTGKVESPEIIRSISPELDAEAIRIVGSMPDWTPGKSGGKPVACYFTIPISFKLEKDAKPAPQAK